LTAHAEAAATTAWVEIFLASTSDEVKRVLGEGSEIRVSQNPLTHVVGNNQKLILGDVTISTDTNSIDFDVGDLTKGVLSSIGEIFAASYGISGAALAINIGVVVTVSDHKEDLLGTSTALDELIDTQAHTGGDGGTAAAA